jgi:hypothetical protein
VVPRTAPPPLISTFPQADLNITVRGQPSMIAQCGLSARLPALVRVLSWLALLARSNAAKDIEILRCATRSRSCAAPTPGQR